MIRSSNSWLKSRSRFHQRLCEDLKDPEFAVAFCNTSAEIARLQIFERAGQALNISENLPSPRKRESQDTQHKQD